MSLKKTIARNAGMIIALMFLSAFVLYWLLNSARMLNAMFLIVAVPLLLFFVLLAFGKIRMDDATVFLISLTVLGLCFCFIFPPMAVPDEPFHYLSTYWVVDCLTGKGSLSSSDVLLRHDDWLFYSKYCSTGISANSYLTIVGKFSFFCSSGNEHMFAGQSFSLSGINVSAKLFTIFGMLLGKVLNLGAYPTFYLGRLFRSALLLRLHMSLSRLRQRERASLLLFRCFL